MSGVSPCAKSNNPRAKGAEILYLLMTRPRAASERFVAQLPIRVQERVTPIYSPLLEIHPTSARVKTKGVSGIIFSSANGVNAAASMNVTRKVPAFCVGPATTVSAQAAGWTARMMGETAEELVAGLLNLRPATPLLHLRGEHSRGNVAERLTQSGLTTYEQAIYQQNLLDFTDQARAAMCENTPVIAPIFSPRTARQFADLWSGSAPIWVAAISEATAEPLKTLKYKRLRIAKKPTPKKMRKAVKKLVKDALRVEGAVDAD